MLKPIPKEQIYNFESNCKRMDEEIKQEFERLYQKYQGEYLLYFLFEYMWEYQFNNISVKILLHRNTGIEEITPIKIRHIWPNKAYFSACLRKGRKAGNGILLPFKSLEELQGIKCIEAFWAIEALDSQQRGFLKIVHVKYDLEFKQLQGGRFFGFHSKEWPFEKLKKQDSDRAPAFPSLDSYRAGKKLYIEKDKSTTADELLFGWVDISESQLSKEVSKVYTLFGDLIHKFDEKFIYESYFGRNVVTDNDIYGLIFIW